MADIKETKVMESEIMDNEVMETEPVCEEAQAVSEAEVLDKEDVAMHLGAAKEAEDQKEEPAPEIPKDRSIVNETVDELGVISEDTRIVGNIVTRGHLAVAGTIEGDIEANGNVIITGIVKGNIKCDNLILDGCNLTTIIKAAGDVEIKEGSSVKGEVHCRNLNVRGHVDGLVRATEKTCIYKGAYIVGDVEANELGIEFGAKLVGRISM